MTGLLDFMGTGVEDPRFQATNALAQSLLGRGGGLQRLSGGLGNYGSTLEVLKNQELRRKLAEAQIAETEAQAENRRQLSIAAAQKLANQQRVQGLLQSELAKGQGANWQALIANGVDPKIAEALANAPRLGQAKVARIIETTDAQGNKILVQADENGNPIGGAIPGYVAPHLVNQGNKQTFAIPQVGASFPMGMSPSDQVSIRGQNMVDARAREKLAQDQALLTNELGDPAQAGMVKMFGKPQAGYRWKPDGSLEAIPGGPADQKAQLKQVGEGTVDGVVAELRDKFNQLKDAGGITSTSNGVGTNLMAAAGGSGVGQVAGRALGTKNQSIRQAIFMARPLLLQAIMKANGMSAKQMDSNAELKLWLSTATDPDAGYEANMDALERLGSLYGSGGAGGSKTKTVNFADLK